VEAPARSGVRCAPYGPARRAQCLAPFLIITPGLGAAISSSRAELRGGRRAAADAELGNMLGGVLAEAFKAPWWMVVFPGAAITVYDPRGEPVRDALARLPRPEAHVSRGRG